MYAIMFKSGELDIEVTLRDEKCRFLTKRKAALMLETLLYKYTKNEGRYYIKEVN